MVEIQGTEQTKYQPPPLPAIGSGLDGVNWLASCWLTMYRLMDLLQDEPRDALRCLSVFSALEILQVECRIALADSVSRMIAQVGSKSAEAEQYCSWLENALWSLDCEVECFRLCLREAAIISEQVGRA